MLIPARAPPQFPRGVRHHRGRTLGVHRAFGCIMVGVREGRFMFTSPASSALARRFSESWPGVSPGRNGRSIPSSGTSGRSRNALEVMERLNSSASALSLARPTWHQGQMGSPQTKTGIVGALSLLMCRPHSPAGGVESLLGVVIIGPCWRPGAAGRYSQLMTNKRESA